MTLALILLPSHSSISKTQTPELCPDLEFMSPFLGDWEGEFQNSSERPPVFRSWKSILGGQAVRETRRVPDFAFEAESIFYFNRATGTVEYLGLTDNGYVSRGQIVFREGEFVQTGDQIQPDGTTSAIKVTYRFEDGPTITNQLFNLVDGVYQPGHVITYTLWGSRQCEESDSSL